MAGETSGGNGTAVQQTERPVARAVQIENVPAELKARPQWVAWRYEWRGGKWTKLPINCRTGAMASSTDLVTWCTFEVALAFYRTGQADGIGYVFADADAYSGVDVDDCRDPETGQLSDLARSILGRLDSYTEISPSHEGTKTWVKGKLPVGSRCKNPKLGVEMYSRDRFFTVTGLRLGEYPAVIGERQEQLKAVYAEVFPGKKAPPAARSPAQLGDDAIIDKAKAAQNGAKFSRLWSGDASGYGSPSEADLALCGMLAFWTGPDPGRIDVLFRRSGLMREKWEREDYRQATIAEALAGRTEFYAPRSAPAAPKDKKDDPGPGPGVREDPPCAWQIIVGHWKAEYGPTFKRGDTIYSEKLGREVKKAEATYGADAKLIEKLTEASDAPRDRKAGYVPRDALPKFFKEWAPTAWVELRKEYPEETDADEISPPAQEDFRDILRRGLLTMLTLEHRQAKSDGELQRLQERRSLVSWCGMLAKPGGWQSLRSLFLWFAMHEERLRVALRTELFTQVPAGRVLAGMSQYALTQRCERYGLGKRIRLGNKIRAVELTPEFLAELIPEKVPGVTPRDDVPDEAPPAHAGEEIVTLSPNGENVDATSTYGDQSR